MPLVEGALTRRIIGAAVEVHRALGPGLLESAYAACLAEELTHIGIAFEREVPLPVSYRGVLLDCGYRLDLVVEDKVIVELKAVQEVTPLHEAQLLTYLKLSSWHVGLLINFCVPVLTQGVVRRVV